MNLGRARLTCLFASIAIRQTQRSASRERSLAIHLLFDPGLEGVTDQTGNQPAKANVLRLGGLPLMDQQII